MKQAIQIDNARRNDDGTAVADVTINGETRTLRAWMYEERVTVFGLAARMGRTGNKVWRAVATLWPSGNISVARDGNFRNPHGSGLRLVGFYADVTEKALCQHSSQFTRTA